jgi:hypothetical protein
MHRDGMQRRDGTRRVATFEAAPYDGDQAMNIAQ